MATISGFKSQMQGGGARPNQFRVDLTFPTIAGANATFAGQTGQFLCKSSTLPASNIEDVVTLYRGRPVHFAGERSFQPWSVSIYNDTNFLIRNVLEEWSGRIIAYTSTNGAANPALYQAQMSVHQLDRQDRVIKTYTFYDAYPTSVGQIALDYESNNQIEVFDVEFTYNYFVASNVQAG